jgi:competence protein ComEC
MNNKVEMVFWDVQHGHATYIKTPNNRHIVIDLGTGKYSSNNMTFSPLSHLKTNYGVSQLDYVVITHPHRDHLDDIFHFDSLSPKALSRPQNISKEDIMNGGQEHDNEKLEKYCEIDNRYNTTVADDSYDNPRNSGNWGGLNIRTFNAKDCNPNNINNFSIVTIIDYANTKVVIPGDNERASYEELLENSNFISAISNADILLAPHHGRESGFNIDFVNHVKPRLSIVSDGGHYDYSANNRYSQKSLGWIVHKKDGTSSERKCLTTNSDGAVRVEFGFNDANNPYLYVKID